MATIARGAARVNRPRVKKKVSPCQEGTGCSERSAVPVPQCQEALGSTAVGLRQPHPDQAGPGFSYATAE